MFGDLCNVYVGVCVYMCSVSVWCVCNMYVCGVCILCIVCGVVCVYFVCILCGVCVYFV